MKLDVAAAEKALRKQVADPLGMSVVEAADGVLRIAATAMSYAVKGVTTERGLDAGDFALVAYGGAGPLHAVMVAREIGIRQVIIPFAPGVFSAYGMLFADLRYDYVRTSPGRLADADFGAIEKMFKAMEEDGRAAVAAAAVAPRAVTVKRAMDMRYVGQEHAVTVDLPLKVFREAGPQGDQAAFRRHASAALRHQCAGGACRDRQPARDRFRRNEQAAPRQAAQRARPRRRAQPSPASARRISARSSCRRRPIRAARSLAGNKIAGPALIEEHASTTVLMPGDKLGCYGRSLRQIS